MVARALKDLGIIMLQLTPADKAAAAELAKLLGVSCDDLIREFESLSVEEQAELERTVGEANAILPGLNAALDRIAANTSSCRSKVCAINLHLSAMSDRVSLIENSLGITKVG